MAEKAGQWWCGTFVVPKEINYHPGQHPDVEEAQREDANF
jgi:hypothetical protein